jgi:hypothetical protein
MTFSSVWAWLTVFKVGDVVTALAVLAAPIVALRLQKTFESREQRRQRKLWIFQTLMMNRSAPFSLDVVRALNMIDFEFNEDTKQDREIKRKWDIYFEHLRTTPPSEDKKEGVLLFYKDREDKLSDLLVQMGERLEYKFDKHYVKTPNYLPDLLQTHFWEDRQIRLWLLGLSRNETTLPTTTRIVNDPPGNQQLPTYNPHVRP